MKIASRAKFWLICSIPLLVFLLDLVIDGILTKWQLHDIVHMMLVGISALGMFFLLKFELSARHSAEEALRKEHEGLEVLAQKRAEEYSRSLRYEQSVLEAIMENSEAMLVYLDPEMRFVHANSAYVKNCGHTREELIGRNHFALFPDAENEAIFRRARDTGEPVSYVAKPFEFADQPWRGVTYWDWTLVPVKDPAGSVSGLVFSLRDVTEERRAAERREEHLARLNALIKVSERALGERTAENLFQGIADAAREITDARVGVAGHGYMEGKFNIRAASRAENAPSCPTEVPVSTEARGLYLTVMESTGSFRLTDAELRSHPDWRGLPPGHYPLRGLLGVPMNSRGMAGDGFIMVSDKRVGDFTVEDEALLSELAALASLGLQHINARTDAERYAARLDAIFGAMTNAVIVYDVAGVVARANPAALRIMGFDPVGSSAQSVLTRLRMHDDEGHAYDLTDLPSYRALAGEVVLGMRLLVHGFDGVERIIRASASPLLLGEVRIGAVSVWADETERERLVRQVETESAKLKAIIDTAPAAIIVTDGQASIQMANPAAERLFSRRFRAGASFESQAEYDLLHEDGSPYEVRDLPVARSAIFGEEHQDVEMQIRWPDGRHCHLVARSTPIRDAVGGVNGAVGIFLDITERKHNEEALEQREHEYSLLMEQAADGIILVDPSGKIVAANSRVCEILGYEREELVLKNGQDLIPSEDLPLLAERFRTITLEKSVTAEHRACRKDGTLLYAETSARRMSDGRIQSIVRDITERKKLEEEYSRAVKTHVFDRLFGMLREFQHGEVLAMNLHRLALFARNLSVFSDPSHTDDSARLRLEAVVKEFRALTEPKLVGIASVLRMVEEEFAAGGAARGEYVSAAEVLALTEGLREDTEKLLATVEAPGKRVPQIPPESGVVIADRADTLLMKISGVIRQMNERCTASLIDVTFSTAGVFRAKRPDIPIEIVESGQGLRALIRPPDLAEILSLLLSNAIDALAGVGSVPSLRDPRVTIRLREQEGQARIEVEDTGSGVPPEIRERIFERDFSTKGEGHGNGLVYARDHLSPFGGELSYEEPAEGGARFVITLVRM